MPASSLHVLVGLALGSMLMPALAQWSGSATLMSDYQYHGVSLSSGTPAFQLAANYDARHGVYAGASVTRADVPNSRARSVLMMYLGMARPLNERLNWEAGAMRMRYPGDSSVDYTNYYLGLAGQHGNLRVHLMPGYLGGASRAGYLELNLVRSLGEHVDVFLHAGHLHTFSVASGGARPAPRRDLRVGLASGWEAWSVQLALGHAHQDSVAATYTHGYGYTTAPQQAQRLDKPDKLVVSVSRAF